jgi:co-chaperonin GroES (HSP10)
MIEAPGDKVFVKPLRPHDMIGSIVVPDQALPRVNQGIVMYMGPNARLFPELKEGDHVLFGAYSGASVYLEDEGELIVLRRKYIYCIIEDDPCDVPGLYFKDLNGEYFTATYEQAITLCVRALRKQYRAYKFKDELTTRLTQQQLDEDLADEDE